MRRRLILITVAAFSAGLASAQAGSPGYYISGDVGASFLPDLHIGDASGTNREHFDTSVAAGGALGWDTGDGFRFELDSLSQNSMLNGFSHGVPATGHLSSTSLMANATVDLLPQSFVTPYMGAGLGLQNVGGEVNGLTGRAFKPAYQAEAGLRDDITDQVSLFGEYRFSQSESVTLSDPTEDAHQHFSDHALLAGLSYKFAQ